MTQRPRETVKARLCVAVNHEGQWNVAGEADLDAGWHVMATGDGLRGNIKFYWVTVELASPPPPKWGEGRVYPTDTTEFAAIELSALLGAAQRARKPT